MHLGPNHELWILARYGAHDGMCLYTLTTIIDSLDELHCFKLACMRIYTQTHVLTTIIACCCCYTLHSTLDHRIHTTTGDYM